MSLESADFGAKQAKGYFTIYLVTALELSSTKTLDSSNTVFESNSVHRRLVSVQAPLKSTKLVSALITYKRGWNPLDYWWYGNKEIQKSTGAVCGFPAEGQYMSSRRNARRRCVN